MTLRLRNQLVELLDAFPNAKWNETRLGANVNIEEEFLRRTKRTHDFHTSVIKNNPNISWKTIKNCIDRENHTNVKMKLLPADINASNIQCILEYIMKKDTCKFLRKRKILSNPLITIFNIDSYSYQKDQEHFAKIRKIYLSSNPNVTSDDLMSYDRARLDSYLDLWKLSNNKNLTWEFISQHIGLIGHRRNSNWDIYWLSKNPVITWEIIKSTQHILKNLGLTGWNFMSFAKHNPNMNLSVVHESLTSGPHHFEYIYSWVSYYPGITPEILEMYPDNSWDYRYLSGCKGIPFSYMKNHREKPWIFNVSTKITYEDVIENSWIRWPYGDILAHEHLFTDERIYEFLEGKYSAVVESNSTYEMLSKNSNVTAAMIKKYPYKPWAFNVLSSNIFNKNPLVVERLKTEGWNYGKNADHFDRVILREVMTLMLCNVKMSVSLPFEIINMITDYMIYV